MPTIGHTMTKREIQAILFVSISLLIGALVLLVKQFEPDFMPDLAPASADGRLHAEESGQSLQSEGNAMAMPYAQSESPQAKEGAGGERQDRPVPSQPVAEGNLYVLVNTAPASELQKLPGIGPRLAERIIAYRKNTGSFERMEQLLEVKGIGPVKLDRMRPFVQLR